MSADRQLAAIMFTDIVGYTRLMGQSEEKALEVLQQNRAVQKPLIEQFNGTFIKELGDGTMASFSKSTDAVRCAMAIQKASAEHPDLKLRIGIHLGEVVFEDGDVFGDGVNIAARIESAGRAGAIFISGAVHGTVHNKDDIQTRFVEQMELKNVNRPIDIYEVAIDGQFSEAGPKPKSAKSSNKGKFIGVGIAIAVLLAVVFWFTKGSEGSAKQLDHASIAVLPFENMSSDSENEFFCDGVTEDILTHLSKLKNLKVISRTSIMHYKGSALTLPEIAKELDVEYIVEGSVRKQGERVAITAQLIHAESDGHLWADNYDRTIEDAFAIQREVAQEIASVLNIKISMEERGELKKSDTENVDAYREYLAGREAADGRTEAGLLTSIDHYKKAVEHDPLYALAYADMAYSYDLLNSYYGYPSDSVRKLAEEYLNTAKEIDPDNNRVLTTDGMFLFYDGDRDAGRRSLERAVELYPNDATAHHLYSWILRNYSRADLELAMEEILLAESLDPYSTIIKGAVAQRFNDLGRYQETLEYLEANASIFKEYHSAFTFYYNAYVGLNQWEKVDEILEEAKDGQGRFTDYPRINRLEAESDFFYHIGNIDRALLALNEAIDIEPEWIEAYTRYVNWAMLFGRFEEAEAIMETDGYKKYVPEERHEAQIADLHYYKGDLAKASEIYLQHDPDGFNSAAVLIRSGDQTIAREFLNDPSNKDQHYMRVYLLTLLGEKDSALTYFEMLKDWRTISESRWDPDMRSLWDEPRYKAKVAEYNFPPLKDQ